jgi:hypothetical protein
VEKKEDILVKTVMATGLTVIPHLTILFLWDLAGKAEVGVGVVTQMDLTMAVVVAVVELREVQVVE